MFKRWIIRGFFIWLVLLCMGGWAWSYGRSDGVGYLSDTGRGWLLSSGGSALALCYGKNDEPPTEKWVSIHDTLEPSERHVFFPGGTSFLGFGYTHLVAPGHEFSAITIPYWLPTILAAFSLCFVWWGTRKRKAGGDFPVELAGKKEDVRLK